MMRLLLIEDDFDFGAALHRALRQLGFYSVWVRQLRDGQQQLTAFEFDCVLLDLNLPDGDGCTLLHALRQQDMRIPVLVISARDALDDRLNALNGGADDYVIKPFLIQELVARIHALIRRSAGQASTRWRIGALELDTQAQTLFVDGREINLTVKEYCILRELAVAAGRVVRRQQLVERVWPGEDEPSNGAIEFHVHGLRRKLGAERINTVRGVGYLLVNE